MAEINRIGRPVAQHPLAASTPASAPSAEANEPGVTRSDDHFYADIGTLSSGELGPAKTFTSQPSIRTPLLSFESAFDPAPTGGAPKPLRYETDMEVHGFPEPELIHAISRSAQDQGRDGVSITVPTVSYTRWRDTIREMNLRAQRDWHRPKDLLSIVGWKLPRL